MDDETFLNKHKYSLRATRNSARKAARNRKLNAAYDVDKKIDLEKRFEKVMEGGQ
jgi:hypothetical protein